MTVHLLEELSSRGLDALDRARTAVFLTVSPLEQHGPHLPVGVDAFTGRMLAESVARRLVDTRSGWSAVLAPTLHLGSFAFQASGTVTVRQRVLRAVVTDCGAALARAGFRWIFVANGHGGPGHLVALEEASRVVSRRHGVTMASLTGGLVWSFLRGGYVDRLQEALGRPLSAEERAALADDSHGGLWETSVMLWLRPELVDESYRTLPGVRYSLLDKLRPNYPLRNGGQGYAGHPALADPALARAAHDIIVADTYALVEGLLDGRLRARAGHSPFYALPFLRTHFWPTAGLGALALLGLTWLGRRALRGASRGGSS